jgi:hypothetical protein
MGRFRAGRRPRPGSLAASHDFDGPDKTERISHYLLVRPHAGTVSQLSRHLHMKD